MQQSAPILRKSLLSAMTGLALCSSAQAGDRHFTYSYETTTMAAGAMELETWMTWKSQQADDPGTDSFDLRHEFEYGVTDRLTRAAVPTTSALGSAIYGEIKGSDDFIELEAKLLLQKNLGNWMIVYNVGGEIEWENDYRDDEAELMQSL